MIEIDTKVFNEELGNGIVTRLFKDSNMCFIKFETKSLNVMCSIKPLITIYDNKRRVIKKYE